MTDDERLDAIWECIKQIKEWQRGETCEHCGTRMTWSSHGKFICSGCGFIKSCCD